MGEAAGEWDPLRDLVLAEEVARARLPPLTDQTHLAGFALLKFGSEAQKARHLPAIRDGRDTWCQLFSEPEAGSDLGAMRTRARREGDEWVVDGQKVWSSNAAWSDFGFLLARTGTQESQAPRDQRVRGRHARAGDRHPAAARDHRDVGLQRGVLRRLPAAASTRCSGAENDGWRVAMESLGAERSGIGAGAARLRLMLDDLVALARERGRFEDGAVREQLGRFAAEVEVCNLLVYARLERELAGGADRPPTSRSASSRSPS